MTEPAFERARKGWDKHSSSSILIFQNSRRIFSSEVNLHETASPFNFTLPYPSSSWLRLQLHLGLVTGRDQVKRFHAPLLETAAAVPIMPLVRTKRVTLTGPKAGAKVSCRIPIS